MPDASWPRGAYAAEFDDERHFAGALAMLRDAGYTKVEAYSPYPVDRVEPAIDAPPSLLPYITFAAGAAGAAVSYWIQWYASAVSYPLDVGGRPPHSPPAFFIPTFEGTVFFAAVTLFFALWLVLRLPRPWHPMFEAEDFERASIDRYWVAIDATDHRADPVLTPRDLERLEPLRVVRVPGDA